MSSSEAPGICFSKALATKALAYTLNVWALQRLSVATTTVFNYLRPPLTEALAWGVFGEAPPWQLALAFVRGVMACGLALSAE